MDDGSRSTDGIGAAFVTSEGIVDGCEVKMIDGRCISVCPSGFELCGYTDG